jgi:hypothetical protein
MSRNSKAKVTKVTGKTKRTASSSEKSVGRRAELLDHERAVVGGINYADDRYPMQPNPDHGPHK